MRRFQQAKSFLKLFQRFYCCKPPESIKVDVEKTVVSVEKEVKADISEECAKFEEQVVKQALLEKEQDASLQSRLAKDCKLLFSKSSKQLTIKQFSEIRLDEMVLPKDATESPKSGSFELYLKDMDLQQTLETSPAPKDVTTDKITVVDSSGGKKMSDGNRPIRQEPGKVLLTFIPQEWWYALMPKTGVTGLGTFFFTFATYLVSKEHYVLEHYYYHGLSVLVIWVCGIKYLGPTLAKYLDKEVDAYEAAWNEDRVKQKEYFSESIINELHLQFQMDGQLMITDVKRENVQLQLEEEYRKRLMYAYNEVKNRLDYHVAVELIRERIQHRNLIEYVTAEVTKAITPEMQDKLIYYSIDRIVEDLAKITEKK
ncbi:unnamed protein product [Ceutorhynchus assimilis]|uniref:ATP synthase subunit b n=1 Tax=Ceutorhynchus assimilis TaxID=467358 RepID=A0A9N9QF28_9CUCU|nr:unnamed protein product [Ceutorhynchus assimilis]